jgi:SAM-dependent methyltransferase
VTQNNPEFDNAVFWNCRYSENPKLGSGIGSRGLNLLHKRKIVDSFLRVMNPQSVLDVGCGDHEVLSGLRPVPDYLGVDISAIVVSQNSERFPNRRFKCLDFASLSEVSTLRSDVVLCLEVLIHQHSLKAYTDLVRNLIAAAKKGGLVSAYISDPRLEIESEIIAWHESITATFYREGAKDVLVLAHSLESDCLAFVSFRK